MDAASRASAAGGADPSPVVALAAEHRTRGNAHFTAGRFGDAAAEYTAAIAAATQHVVAAGESKGALTRELVLSHTNRASCALRQRRFADALDDTWAALEACVTPCAPRRRREFLAGAGWEWTKDAYRKAALVRARAAKAAGVLLSAHAYASAAPTPAVGAQAAAVHAELEKLKDEVRSTSGVPPVDASPDCVVAGSWTTLRVAPGAPAPVPRRAAAVAIVGGFLHVFGGANAGAASRHLPNPRPGQLGDAWRAPCVLPADASAPAPPLRWERLPTPAKHSGPSPSNCPRGAACAALSLFVVLARGELWTLQAGSGTDGRAWSALGSPWRGSSREAAYHDEDDHCALTVCDTAAFLLRRREGIVRICLRTGDGARLRGSADDGAPQRNVPLLWPAAGCTQRRAKLRVWGDDDTFYDDVVESDPPREADMLVFERGAWSGATRGGGGAAVPLPRNESALVPLPRGGAILVGGFTDRCGSTGIPKVTETGAVHISLQGSRLLNDVHLYDEAAGWRAVRATGEPPPPAGQCCAALDAASGAVLVLGGWGDGPLDLEPGGDRAMAPDVR